MHLAVYGVILSFFLEAVSCYVQSGWFEAACVFRIFTTVATGTYYYIMQELYINPVLQMFPAHKRVVHLGQAGMTGTTMLATFSCVIVMLITCRAEDPLTYNNAACASFLILATFITVTLALLIHFSRRIVKALTAASLNINLGASSSVPSLIEKYQRLERFGWQTVPSSILSAFAWPVVHLYLGSFPFHFIAVFFQNSLSYPLGMVGFVIVLARSTRRDVLSSNNVALGATTIPNDNHNHKVAVDAMAVSQYSSSNKSA